MDKHINDNITNAFKIDPQKKLLINTLLKQNQTAEEYIRLIADRLQIDKENIVIENCNAKVFFQEKLNVDFFASIFPYQIEEDVLPQ